MTAIIWLCGIFLLLCLILSLRFRLLCSFGEKTQAELYIGFWKVRKKSADTQLKKSRKSDKKQRKKASWQPSFADYCTLAKTALSALKDSGIYFCRHVKIDPLSLCITFAGTDPADVAETFGIANAAMWSLMPRVEELFAVPHPAIHLDMDFEAEQTKVTGKAAVEVRLGTLIMCLLILAIPLLRWYQSTKSKHTAVLKQQIKNKSERTQNDGKESTDQ